MEFPIRNLPTPKKLLVYLDNCFEGHVDVFRLFLVHFQAEKFKKIAMLQEKERKSRNALHEQMCKMIRSLYLQAKGHGYVTDTCTNEYQGLVQQLRGMNSVTWNEEAGDSSSRVSTPDEGRKRKHVDNLPTPTHLDNTFTLASPKSPRALACAEQLMVKGGLIHHCFSVIVTEILHGIIVTYSVLRQQ